MTPVWAAELAGQFWAAVGAAPPFPRDVERWMGRALPVTVAPLPGLRVAAVAAWLAERGAAGPAAPDRPLRACLVARAGCAVVFLDAADPPDERRFSAAHELAHFLRDYRQPRDRAAARLGAGARAVLDGERPPTPAERLHAALAGVPLGLHTHLFDRFAVGGMAPAVAAAERDADRLAYELLAPADAVFRRGEPTAALARRLRDDFGLPPAHAAAYAALLAPPAPPPHPLLARLRRI